VKHRILPVHLRMSMGKTSERETQYMLYINIFNVHICG